METGDERRITVEMLKARIAELERQRERAYAAYQARHGAIQECEFWLEVLTSEEKKDG